VIASSATVTIALLGVWAIYRGIRPKREPIIEK
jgi:hypothetical protein